jgi:hypothetical protein
MYLLFPKILIVIFGRPEKIATVPRIVTPPWAQIPSIKPAPSTSEAIQFFFFESGLMKTACHSEHCSNDPLNSMSRKPEYWPAEQAVQLETPAVLTGIHHPDTLNVSRWCSPYPNLCRTK